MGEVRHDKSLRAAEHRVAHCVVCCGCVTDLDIKFIVPTWDKIGAQDGCSWRDRRSQEEDVFTNR